MIRICSENLTHFTCYQCKSHFSVSDMPKDKKRWFCCWCGEEQDVFWKVNPKQVLRGVQENKVFLKEDFVTVTYYTYDYDEEIYKFYYNGDSGRLFLNIKDDEWKHLGEVYRRDNKYIFKNLYNYSIPLSVFSSIRDLMEHLIDSGYVRYLLA